MSASDANNVSPDDLVIEVDGEGVTPNASRWSGNALLTDAYPSALRASYGAAKHER